MELLGQFVKVTPFESLVPRRSRVAFHCCRSFPTHLSVSRQQIYFTVSKLRNSWKIAEYLPALKASRLYRKGFPYGREGHGVLHSGFLDRNQISGYLMQYMLVT